MEGVFFQEERPVFGIGVPPRRDTYYLQKRCVFRGILEKLLYIFLISTLFRFTCSDICISISLYSFPFIYYCEESAETTWQSSGGSLLNLSKQSFLFLPALM